MLSKPFKAPDREFYSSHDAVTSHRAPLQTFYSIPNTLKNLETIRSIPQRLFDGGFITSDKLETVQTSVESIIGAALNFDSLDPSDKARIVRLGLVDFNSAVVDHESLLKTLIPEEKYNIDTLIAQNLYISSIVYNRLSDIFTLDFLKNEIKIRRQNVSVQEIKDYLEKYPDFLKKLSEFKINPESK